MAPTEPVINKLRQEPCDELFKDSIFTVPNVICFIRLFGAIFLIGFAWAGWLFWFVVLFLILSLSDLIDGTLARWLHQRSDFGARLDSIADLTLNAVLLFGCALLRGEQFRQEWIWLLVAIGSYFLATAAGLWKFGRMPSYHTYAAKATYGIALIAGLSLLLDWSVWPLRIAAIAATLANLESTAITYVLKEWQADILTLRQAWPENVANQQASTRQSTTHSQ